MASIKRSLAWSFTTQYSQMIFTFITSVILARLLNPGEIGIFSVAMVIVGFASLLRDFGVSEYLVQEKDLTDKKIKTAFTFNVMTGWTMGIVLYLCSGAIASFYNDPMVKQVMNILALNFIFVPIGATTFALLRRDMRFGETSRIQLLAMLITSVVSLSCAFYGLGALSMAWGALAGAIITSAGCFFYRRKNIGISFTLSEFPSVWKYSAHSIVLMLTRYTTQSLPELFMGKTMGMHDVGIFNKGRSTSKLVYGAVMGGIKPIMMPLFSRDQSNIVALRTNYLQALNLSLGIVWPCLGFAAYKASEIVLFLFGDQWLESVPVLQAATLGIAVWSTVTYSEELFKATGRIRMLSRIEFFILPLVVLLVVVGSGYNVVVMALLLSTVSVVRAAIVLYILKTRYELPLLPTANTMAKNFILTVLIVMLVAAVDALMPETILIFNLMITGTAFLLAWLLAVVVFKHDLFTMFKKEISLFFAKS